MNGKSNKNRSGFSYSFALYKTGSDDIALSFGPFYSMKTVNVYIDFMDELLKHGFTGFKYLVRMERRKKA